VKVVRDAYLAKLGRPVVISETIFKTIGPAEVFTTDGIEYRRPFYRIVNNGRHIDQAQSEAVNRAVRDLFPRPDPNPVFITPDAPYDETVLIVSDSYGYNAAPEFASAFKRLVHVSTYGMDQSKLPELFARVEKMVPFSRVIMLVMEGNTEQLLAWSRALGAQTQ
jgi:hypothetical protein